MRDSGWHSRPFPEALATFQVDADGLTAAEARERLQVFGANRLAETAPEGPLRRFLRQFNNVLIYVLLGAASITAILGHFVDTAVILAVVLVNAGIGFVQEGRAAEALSAIRDMLAPEARVVRDGRRRTVPAQEVVPGDLVILEAGDRVPADVRLVSARGLRIQEAALTGESVAVEKQTDPVPAAAPLAERSCLAFSGTMVVAGQARGVVVATGEATEIGRISGLVSVTETTATPLVLQMAIFAKALTAVILAAGALILASGLLVGNFSFSEIIMAVVGLSVAAIPEGLPAILTVTLAIGVQGMAQRQAIVRRMPAIEALGSVSVICSDKTGTLAKNEMTVASVATGDRFFTVGGAGYAPHGSIALEGREISPDDFPMLAELATGALLCSDAELVEKGGTWSIDGDPMEGALVTLAHKVGVSADDVRRANPRTDAIPFDAQHRFMATLHPPSKLAALSMRT